MVITPVLRNVENEPTKKWVFIRIHNGGTSPKYKSTRHKIKPKFWNKQGNEQRKNWIKTSHPKHYQLNETIEKMVIQIRGEMEGTLDKNIMKKPAKNATGGKQRYLTYASNYIELIRNKTTKIANEQAIKKLIKFLEKLDMLYLTFDDVTVAFIKGYYNWLLDNYTNASSNQYFGVFRTIYNHAVKDDEMNIEIKSNPFKKMKYQKNTTTNKPMDDSDFFLFRDFPTKGNRAWLISKNIWLFQFVNAFRVIDVMLMRWGNISYKNHEFIYDKFTSKTTERAYRSLPIEAVELLTPAIERYYPTIQSELEPINKQILAYQDKIDLLQENSPKTLTTDDLILLVAQGNDPKELEQKLKKVKNYQDNINLTRLERDIVESEKVGIYKKYIQKLNTEHPNDLIWDKPHDECINVDRMNKEDVQGYKRCLASYHNYLKRMTKMAGITSTMSSHVARHTATQFMYDKGIDFNAISQFLNHSNQTTTESYIKRLGVKNSELTNYLAGHLKS